ncbi:dihydrodipicolinate synthase family protein [Pectinatus haikarae]|uniref:4-hydroxy-tetrahydrodipicolinate synthase n=1 Tax=Pectinatus haikarae TaxID=349096 RepID=A0ABT9YA54_9FIRM|nr:dihydrodipicolinate synthase family protein [Pectinatus haikarae]MDQ0204375.1 4-hydroxy-tetrahydrodipicolinate synthase [Pectinatus haikarae]
MECKYICPILTSINESGSVIYEDMHVLYDGLVEAGIDGVLSGGSAGEFYAFTYDEIKSLLLDAVKYIDHRVIVLAGTGRMAKSETISLSNEVLSAGADAAIIVGPYYSACSQEDIFDYYDDILNKINGNVLIYNYADRTGYDVSSGTILRLLAKHKNLVGVKDTHPVLRHTQKYIQDIKPNYPDFKIFTGYDNNCIASVISGGNGCIGAISNVYPKLCHEVIESLRQEDLERIKQLQRQIDKYMSFYEINSTFNPVMKWAMKEMHKPMQEYCKEPLSALTDENKKKLSAAADKLWRR